MLYFLNDYKHGLKKRNYTLHTRKGKKRTFTTNLTSCFPLVAGLKKSKKKTLYEQKSSILYLLWPRIHQLHYNIITTELNNTGLPTTHQQDHGSPMPTPKVSEDNVLVPEHHSIH